MSDADTSAAKPAREQSTVQFPYADLDEAISVVRVIQEGSGLPMDRDQIAARIGQKATSGAFITKLSAARMFGLTESVPGTSKIQISALGHEAMDSDEMRQRSAKATAFLNVELYAKLHETFKGRQLPPRPLGLEQAMVEMGVATKQRTNARYAFDRSAKQAGFFDHGQDKLVAPVGIAWPQQVRAPDPPTLAPVVVEPPKPRLDGVITALIDKLPEKGPWPADKRNAWLQMMAMAFDMAYGPNEAAPVIQRPAPRVPRAPAPSSREDGGFGGQRSSPREDFSTDLDDEIPF